MEQGPAAAALTKVIANSTNVKSMRLRGSLEELIDRTAHTGRVSPRTAENVNQMAVLEEAIEGREEVSFLYRSQIAQKASVRAVRPLGLYSPDLATWWLLRAVERPRRTDWTF
jgi:predicted DNA-binding transcriptional regulator YafY